MTTAHLHEFLQDLRPLPNLDTQPSRAAHVTVIRQRQRTRKQHHREPVERLPLFELSVKPGNKVRALELPVSVFPAVEASTMFATVAGAAFGIGGFFVVFIVARVIVRRSRVTKGSQLRFLSIAQTCKYHADGAATTDAQECITGRLARVVVSPVLQLDLLRFAYLWLLF